jgi:hypothetical protein
MTQRVRVTKLSDNRFNGNHPNYGSEMPVREGFIAQELAIGRSLVVRTGGIRYFQTSHVTAIREGEFDTENSTYKIEYL